MEVLKIDAAGSGGIGSDEQRQEMLGDFDRQIAEVLFRGGVEAGGARIGGHLAQHAAAQRDMDAVVGQADVRQRGHDDQVVGDDAAVAQFRHGAQLAPRKRAMAQAHVFALRFAAIPARQAGAHEQIAIKRVGNALVELLLPQRRRGREKHGRALAERAQAEGRVGVLRQQMGEEKTLGRFARHGFAHAAFRGEPRNVKRMRFGRSVVAEEMIQQAFADAAGGRVPIGHLAHAVRQRQFDRVADGNPQGVFAAITKQKVMPVGARRAERIALVGRQIGAQGSFGKGVELGDRKANPAVFPYPAGRIAQIGFQIGERFPRGVARQGALDQIGIIVGFAYRLRKVRIGGLADHGGLQLGFASGGGVARRKRQLFPGQAEGECARRRRVELRRRRIERDKQRHGRSAVP
ncbi:MAG: hypothetical protein BWZ10_02874 [candidate division BRC1 bacterium ADurb.BinA364]|nr:MAG: hypothetical protein BWZ10_02874 [candidate division BRC1 bacterium ADurb.BinA364]